MSKKSKQLGLDVIDTHMGLFDYTVRVCIGNHEKALEYIAYVFEDKYEELPDGNRGYEARGICYHKTGFVPIVWLPKYPETPREYGTFAHEVIHAINHLFDWSATPLSRDTEETFAHAVAHVITSSLTKLKVTDLVLVDDKPPKTHTKSATPTPLSKQEDNNEA